MTGRSSLTGQAPASVRALLWLVPGRHREVVLGDLLEEYAHRVESGADPRRARSWLRAQAFHSARTGLFHRIYDAARGLGSRIRGGSGRPGAGRGRNPMDAVSQDLRYASRRLLRSPGFTAVAVVSLALGIGANTALFTVVNALLLRGEGLENPSEWVDVYTSEDSGYLYSTSSYPDFFDLRDAGEPVFQDVVAFATIIAQTEVDGAEPRLTMGEIVSGNYFDALGVRPVLGRGFVAEEDRTPDTHPVVVLGYEYWERMFNRDPDVIGKTLRILRRPYTVVGVAPESFGGMWPGIRSEIFVPQMMADHVSRAFGSMGGSRLERRGTRSLFLKGHLQPGTTPDQAAEWLAGFSRGLEETYPESNDRRVMNLLPSEDVALHPFVDRAIVPVAGLLFAVVCLVLLIACTNLASFLLARGEDRKKEIAVRLAMGARRWTLVRQLLTETVLLSVAGGLGGLLLAGWTVSLLLSFRPPFPLPVSLDLGIDGTVFAFTLGVALAAGILFGLVPALQSTSPDVAPTLRDESGGSTGSRRRWSLRNGLVVAQVSLSFVLLIGAGLFVRSLQKAQAIDPGFDTGPAAIVWPNLEMSLVPDEEGQLLWDELVRRAEAVQGIDRVTLVDRLPLGFGVQVTDILPEDVAPPEGLDAYEIDFALADERYFDVMAVPILRGRGLEVTDTEDSEDVVVVSEAFVQRFWPGDTGLGRTLDRRGRTFRVVGVARDTKVRTLGEEPRPYVYFHRAQGYNPLLFLLARGTLPEAQMLARLQDAMRQARSDLVLMDATTMTRQLGLPLYMPRMAAILLAVFGGLALLLSGIGLYGVVSYAVSRRTREVGIRISLGADARRVVAMVVGGGLRLVVTGGLVGLVLSAAVTWVLSRFLYGISTLDVATFVAIPLLLTGVATMAAWVPARRASRVNPVEALRSE